MTETEQQYDIATFRSRISDLQVVENFAVATEQDAATANEQLKEVKRIGKDVEAAKRERLAPLKEQEREIRERFAPIETMLETAERTVKTALLEFMARERARADAERAAAHKKAAEERAKLEAAARAEREKREAQAARLEAQGKAERAAAVREQALIDSNAAEATAQMLATQVAPAAPTKLAGSSARQSWTGEVVDTRRALSSLLADETLDIDELVAFERGALNRLAGVYKDKLATKYPGLRGAMRETLATRA
jgi:uncharacterized phage infection (PIP) family protein YhgE